MDLVTKIPIVTDEGDVVIFGDLIGPDGFTLGIGDEDSSETIMTFGADEVSFSDKVGIGGAAGSAKLAVVGGYLDIILTGKDGLGQSRVLQTKSDGKTIGDALGWNFNLRGSNDASANYAKFVIGITDPTAGALKGYFSIHTVGAIDGIAERFRINDLGDAEISGALDVTGIATLGDGSLLKTSAAPTTDAMIANKKYVDDNAGGDVFELVDTLPVPTQGRAVYLTTDNWPYVARKE